MKNFIKNNMGILNSIAIAVSSTVIMALSLSALSFFLLVNDVSQIPGVAWILFAICFYFCAVRQLFYIYKTDKKIIKIDRYVNAFLLAVAATMFLIFNDFIYIFVANSIVYFATLVGFIIVKLIVFHRIRDITLSVLSLAICGIILLDCFASFNESALVSVVIVLTTFLAILSLSSIVREAFAKIKFTTLKNIFEKTFAAEILLGLVFLIVAFSFVFMTMEGKSYGDSLWYCFAVVTTIGFGDVVMDSVLCRIISVILGIYGIIVVALITSIIVNFYNDTKFIAKKEDKSESETNKEEKKEEGNE